MIRYALRCKDGHGFEAWFSDSAAYDAQRAAGLVECALCGGREVEKALMAPAVRERSAGHGASGDGASSDGAGGDGAAGGARGAPMSPEAATRCPSLANPALANPTLAGPVPQAVAEALTALRAHVEKSADYVGTRFAEEARARHVSGEGARPVWGEATADDARALIEEGVPIAPLPVMPRRDD